MINLTDSVNGILTLLRHFHQKVNLGLDCPFFTDSNVPENAHRTPKAEKDLFWWFHADKILAASKLDLTKWVACLRVLLMCCSKSFLCSPFMTLLHTININLQYVLKLPCLAVWGLYLERCYIRRTLSAETYLCLSLSKVAVIQVTNAIWTLRYNYKMLRKNKSIAFRIGNS